MILEIYIFGLIVTTIAVVSGDPPLDLFERIVFIFLWFLFVPARFIIKVMD